jgi:hypothetical protein
LLKPVNPQIANARRRPPPPPSRVRARSAARASPWLLGIASAACFGVPLGLACVPQLYAPPRCWCAYSVLITQGAYYSHWGLGGAPTLRVERTSTPGRRHRGLVFSLLRELRREANGEWQGKRIAHIRILRPPVLRLRPAALARRAIGQLALGLQLQLHGCDFWIYPLLPPLP